VSGIVRDSVQMFYLPHFQSINGETAIVKRQRRDKAARVRVITHKDVDTARVRFWHDDHDSGYEQKLCMSTYKDITLHAALDSVTSLGTSLATTAALSTLSHINQIFPLMTTRVDSFWKA